MPDYYTSDVTQLPYSAILNGREVSAPILVRLQFALRKAIGWHFVAESGRCAPSQWHGVEFGALPVSARKYFETGISDFEGYGFQMIGISRTDSIGCWICYYCDLISDDRITVCSLGALRVGVAGQSRSTLLAGLRSDLNDGTILITGRGPNPLSYLIRSHQKIEMMCESASVREMVLRHRERVRNFSVDQFARVPINGVTDYLLLKAKRDWEDCLATGMFRKLSEREVARLKEGEFEFQ